MIKAVFFDVDGTLVSLDTHQIPPSTIQALHALQEKGILVFVATGRHPAMLSHIRAAFPFDGWVTLSGQYCYSASQVVRSAPMDAAAVEDMVAASSSFPCIFFEGEEIYISSLSQAAVRVMEELEVPMPPVREASCALGRDIYQVIAILTREEEHLLKDRAPHVYATRWHPGFMDIIPPQGGKDKGIDALLALYGISAEEAMAFGDGGNDISMLRHVGLGVAMGNASGAVKAQADYVTGTVDEDGIFTALEHLGLL